MLPDSSSLLNREDVTLDCTFDAYRTRSIEAHLTAGKGGESREIAGQARTRARHDSLADTMVPVDFNTRFNQVCGLSSLLGLVVSAIPLFHGVGQYAPPGVRLTLTERSGVLIILSVIILVFHALLWIGLEKLLHKDYATGETPKSWRAAVMSLSLTLPALTVPLFYQYASAKPLLSRNHLHGGILSSIGGAIAYIVLFGLDKNRRGVRGVLLDRFRLRPLWGEVLATLAYALILIVFTATPYRLVVLPDSPAYADFLWPVLASMVTFFGVSAYLLLKYPDSLGMGTSSRPWSFLRGVIAGMFTVVSLCTALYA